MVVTYTIETDGRQADANQHVVLSHTIETDVFDPYNRNRWPHNSRATAFCHAWPILLFALHAAFIPLLSLLSFSFKLTCLFTQAANQADVQTGQQVSGDQLSMSAFIVGIKTCIRCSLVSRILLVTPFSLRIYKLELGLYEATLLIPPLPRPPTNLPPH